MTEEKPVTEYTNTEIIQILRLVASNGGFIALDLMTEIADRLEQLTIPRAVEIQFDPAIDPEGVARRLNEEINRSSGSPKPGPPVPTRPRLPRAPKGGSGVSSPTAPKYQMGEITERDRFLDNANDHRTAMSAAARAMSGAEYDGYDELLALSDKLYRRLREGKTTA